MLLIPRSMKRSAYPAGFLLVLCLAIALPGCREDVTAVIGGEGAYAVYGVISPDFEFQSVRVFPFESVLAPLPNAPLDATVTSTDLNTGEVQVWQDSITIDEHGQYGHVFWSPFSASHGTAYHIEVQRSDGEISSINVSVPPQVVVQLDNAKESQGLSIQPVLVQGGAPRLLHIYTEYRVQGIVASSDGPVFPAGDPLTVRVLQVDRERKVGENWIVDINLTRDYEEVRRVVGASYDPSETSGTLFVLIMGLDFIATIASEDWYPPGGIFDPEVLVNPDLMSNVENGAGFIGAGYRIDEHAFPSRQAYRKAGFIDAEDIPDL